MAEIPDIDTNGVSYIGYWNAIDQGGVDSTNWEPSGVTSQSDVVSVESYDNGVVGDITLNHKGRKARYRAKTDGWIVVWFDRTTEVNGPHATEPPSGPWDFMDFGPQGAYSPNAIADKIIGLFDATSVSGNTGVSSPTMETVGLYNYEFSSATNTSVTMHYEYMSSAGSYDFDITDTFTYSGTPHFVAAAGANDFCLYNGNEYPADYTVGTGTASPETVIVDSPNLDDDYGAETQRYGARLGENIDWAQDSGVQYTQNMYGRSSSDLSGEAVGTNIIMWS